jgi:hypothetical protein
MGPGSAPTGRFRRPSSHPLTLQNMSVGANAGSPEVEESIWVYLAVHPRPGATDTDASFFDALADACEGYGFAVFRTAAADDATTFSDRWVEAIRHAEVCVIDVGATTAASGAELALAYSAGRPVVALRLGNEQLPPALRAIMHRHPAVREIVFEDAVDCVAQLGSVFADPEWQHVIRQAAVADDV